MGDSLNERMNLVSIDDDNSVPALNEHNEKSQVQVQLDYLKRMFEVERKANKDERSKLSDSLERKLVLAERAYQDQIKKLSSKHEKAIKKYHEQFNDLKKQIGKLKNRHDNVDSRFNKVTKLIETNKTALEMLTGKTMTVDGSDIAIPDAGHKENDETVLKSVNHNSKKEGVIIKNLVVPGSKKSVASKLQQDEISDSNSDTDEHISDNVADKKKKKTRSRKRKKKEGKNKNNDSVLVDTSVQERKSKNERAKGTDKNTVIETVSTHDNMDSERDHSEVTDPKKDVVDGRKYSKVRNEACISDTSVNRDSDSYLLKAYQYLMALQDNNIPTSTGSADNVVLLTTAKETENEKISVPYKLNDRVLVTSIEWPLRKRNPTATEIIHHSGTFFTGKPGYRVQIRAQIDRLHGDVYFSVRVLKGVFDDHLVWPLQEKFCITLSPKMKCLSDEKWVIPSAPMWRKMMNKPEGKKDDIFSEWCGPFNISAFIDRKNIVFDIAKAV